MSELYHYGVKGMKWGVRKLRNKDNMSKLNTLSKTGALKPSYSKLTSALDKMTSDEILKKNIDLYANTKKNDLEKLNAYNDYKQASRIKMTQANAMRQRFKDSDTDDNYKFMEGLLGSSNIEKMLNLQYDKAKTMYDYSDEKVNELLKKFKDVPITQVDSYRYIGSGASYISWMGKKYIRK